MPTPAAAQMLSTTDVACRRSLERAAQHLAQGAYSQAVTSLQRAIKAGADAYVTTLKIAEVYRQQHRWDAMFRWIEKAVELAPHRLAAHEQMMEGGLEAGDGERVLAACQALIKLSPRHVPAYNALGAAYMQLGDLDAALRVCNILVRLEPQVAAHHFKKGMLYQHKNEVALAVHEFSVAMLLEPEGLHADAARDALQTLDAFQINQILTLAMEDVVFHTKLVRDSQEASEERGFMLSETGQHILDDLCAHILAEAPAPCRPMRYN